MNPPIATLFKYNLPNSSILGNFVKISDKNIDYKILAELAYETEVTETGSSGGNMDQYTISHGDTIFLNTLNNKIHCYNYNFSDVDLVVGVSNDGKDTRGMLKN